MSGKGVANGVAGGVAGGAAGGAVVEREIRLPASPEQVWDALTEPASVAGWFGARVAWTLAPGGPARFDGDDGTARTGLVEAVLPGRHLRYRWWPEEDEGDVSEVTYSLEPDEDGTRLTVQERQVPPAEAAPVASASWSGWDDRLLRVWAGVCAPVAALA